MESKNEYGNFKSIHCVGGRHSSGTVIIDADITQTGRIILVGKCNNCHRNESMAVIDNTIKAQGLGHLFKNIGKASAKQVKIGYECNEKFLEER